MVTQTLDYYQIKLDLTTKGFNHKFVRTIYNCCNHLIWTVGKANGIEDFQKQPDETRELHRRCRTGEVSALLAINAVSEWIKRYDSELSYYLRPYIYKVFDYMQEIGCFTRIKGTFGPHPEKRTPSPLLQCVNDVAILRLFWACEMWLKEYERLAEVDLTSKNCADNDVSFTEKMLVMLKGEDNLPRHRGVTCKVYFKTVFGFPLTHKPTQENTPQNKLMSAFLFGEEPENEADPVLPSPHSWDLFAMLRRVWEKVESVSFYLPSISNPPDDFDDDPPEKEKTISFELWRQLRRKPRLLPCPDF